MGNNDYTWYFLFMSLFNTNIGLTNVEKNKLQEERQIRIEQKLDKLLKVLGDKDEQ